MLIDCFPFFNELGILEIRLHEMHTIVDKFVIVEAAETYGGEKRDYVCPQLLDKLGDNIRSKILYRQIPDMYPKCTDRISGREREAYLRNCIMDELDSLGLDAGDFVSFSDCDEIPDALAVLSSLPLIRDLGIHRLKQYSYYYNLNTLVDYGHDWASRARVGTFEQVKDCGTMYDFRMHKKNTCRAIENGGWHLSYFGGVERIKKKVAAMSGFLDEYKLFGDKELQADIVAGRDIHHRKCELPQTFAIVKPGPVTHPSYLLNNPGLFPGFFRAETE